MGEGDTRKQRRAAGRFTLKTKKPQAASARTASWLGTERPTRADGEAGVRSSEVPVGDRAATAGRTRKPALGLTPVSSVSLSSPTCTQPRAQQRRRGRSIEGLTR